ncbi:hypothetical protein Tco_0312959 [Tanacetum coccineum]
MEPDTENMTISEYLEYKAAKERRLWDDVRSRRSLTKYNEADVDSFHRNKKPIHTTPPNDDYVAPATKSILDELLEEFGDEILNVATIDEEADPTKDLEKLERLLAMRPQSNFTEIQVDRDITSPRRSIKRFVVCCSCLSAEKVWLLGWYDPEDCYDDWIKELEGELFENGAQLRRCEASLTF